MTEDIDDKLAALAKEASLKSYSPYSTFSVGCAILTDKGEVFTGCNVENISYGLTICAERSAVFNAISAAGPDLKIEKVVIYTPTNEPISPCGACRQVLREFGDDFLVTSICEEGKKQSFSIDQLLPETPAIKFRKDK